MFYWLVDLSATIPVLNVFRYITFRTGGAIFTGALFVFLFGPWIIDHLRLRQGKGQPIRADGPQSQVDRHYRSGPGRCPVRPALVRLLSTVVRGLHTHLP